jgi:hypothetical protein
MEKYLKHRLKKFEDEVLKKATELYTAKNWLVNPYEVMECDKKGLKINGEAVTEIELKNLKQEVKTLEQFRIWQIIQETLKQKAIEKAVLQSENYEQVVAGKMMIHNLGIIKSIVNLIKTI